jgi:WD40 repeat protein
MFVLEVGRGAVEALAFGPDSRMLGVPWGQRGLLLWSDPTSGSEPRTLRTPPTFGGGPPRFSPDGRRIVWRTHRTLFVFDVSGDGNPLACVQSPEGSPGHFQAALTPDGQAVLVSHMAIQERGMYGSRIERRPLADLRAEAATWSVTVTRVIWDDAVFLPDGRTAVILELEQKSRPYGWNLFLVARELATGRELWTSPPNEDGPRSPTLSADGRLLAAWHTKHLTVWRTDDLDRPPVRLKNEGRKYYTDIAFHPSGRYLAATSNDTTVKLYETTTWQTARTFAWEIGRLRSVAFSADGCRAAVGSDKGKILIWDVDL